MLVVEARGAREQLASTLGGVPGVRRITDTVVLVDELLRFRLEVESESVAEEVASALAAAGCKLRELHREQTSLEDVFATLTTADDAAIAGELPSLATAGATAAPSGPQPGSPGDGA
jgi:hypothetical protein